MSEVSLIMTPGFIRLMDNASLANDPNRSMKVEEPAGRVASIKPAEEQVARELKGIITYNKKCPP